MDTGHYGVVENMQQPGVDVETHEPLQEGQSAMCLEVSTCVVDNVLPVHYPVENQVPAMRTEFIFGIFSLNMLDLFGCMVDM